MTEKNKASATADNPSISEEAREFLLRRPARIILVARVVFLLNIFSMLICLWLIKYPDIVRAPFLLTVGPPAFLGEMRVFEKDLKMVTPGQKVLINIDGSSGDRSWSLEGIVHEIPSGLPGEESRRVKIKLLAGIRSGDQGHAGVREGFFGQGEILTGNRRLLDKLLESIFHR